MQHSLCSPALEPFLPALRPRSAPQPLNPPITPSCTNSHLRFPALQPMWASPGCSATHTSRCSPVRLARTLTQVRQARTEVSTWAVVHLFLLSSPWVLPLGLHAASVCHLPLLSSSWCHPEMAAAVCGP